MLTPLPRALQDELHAARTGETDGERAARQRIAELEREAAERAQAHEAELDLAKKTLTRRTHEQAEALRSLELRLRERSEELTALSAEESVELKHEAAGQARPHSRPSMQRHTHAHMRMLHPPASTIPFATIPCASPFRVPRPPVVRACVRACR